ncbi:hypothetical protein PVAND_007291 [Polypedilum vanderplanki]|uniref:Uncharacterized protein n=1 Tax=Polypedilum vanderplanki TaxID=319348 RepID=A0A9J6C6U4_POLVA|nr:hypothetical protein PVAND_007291 [Polypedilum vanderplanki]
MSEIELEKEFKKFRLEEKPLNTEDETAACCCPSTNTIVKSISLLEVSGNKLKVKDRRSNIVRPARLKVLGNSYARKLKNPNDKSTENGAKADISIVKKSEKEKFEEFTSEAFQKMRISSTPLESPSHNHFTPESPLELDKDERLPSTSSSSLNCSTQAKLQQQMSSTECDSTIDEMSDFLAYHLSLFNHRDKYLIDSMYT